MLRRFEIYSVAPDAPPEAVAGMAQAMKDCARYIPEVLHSAIGYCRSDTALNFSWEQAYASPATYRSYMVEPYHAAILDRYLIADTGECITTNNGLGVGLVGYNCDTPEYWLPPGATRRLVAVKLAEGAEAAFAEIAQAEGARAGMMLSVFKDNSFASRWMDGETWIGPEPAFTHLWEQGFPTMDAALAYNPVWRDQAGGMILNSLEVVYEIEAGYGYENGV